MGRSIAGSEHTMLNKNKYDLCVLDGYNILSKQNLRTYHYMCVCLNLFYSSEIKKGVVYKKYRMP